MQRTRSSALAVLVIGLAGCLPEAGPGIGERVVEGRGFADVGLSRGDWILYTQPEVGTGEGKDAFGQTTRTLVAMPRAGGPARVIGSRVTGFWQARTFWDARGRVLIPHHPFVLPQDRTQGFTLTRLDLASGVEEDLGSARGFQVSPDGQSVVLRQPDGNVVVHGADDRVRSLGKDIKDGRFVGPDLYYVDAEGLVRLEPLAEKPERVNPSVIAWRPIPGAGTDGGILVVAWGLAFDRRTIGVIRGVGPGRTVSWIMEGAFLGVPVVSPDGQRVAVVERTTEPTQFRLRVMTLATGTQEAAEVRLGTIRATREPRAPGVLDEGIDGVSVSIAFRPQSPEVWYYINGRLVAVQTGTTVRAPSRDRFVASFVRQLVPFPMVIGQGDAWDGSIFTSSGRRWLFLDADGRMHLGDTNQLDGEGALYLGDFRHLSEETMRELDGGRWLVVRSDPGGSRTDLVVVDPETLTTRLLGRNLGRMALRGRRVLGLIDKLSDDWWAPGTLMAWDLETGAETRLAGNVTDFALEPPCADCEATAPGARLLYVVHARVPFAHDGVWRAVLP